MEILKVEDLVLQFDGRRVLDVPNLSIDFGETFGLIGPNGAGKSTLLRVLNLLETSYQGAVYYDNNKVQSGNRQEKRRQTATVFQEPLLLNTSVWENIATGLKIRHRPSKEIAAKVEAWLERLRISHLAKRPSTKLSGGEAQRVSLARALVLEPRVLFLDEPFSDLDTPTRLELIADLQQLLRETRTTTVFVTHDRDEALTLADRLAIMKDGKILQVGRPSEVFNQPSDEDVAGFVGVETILPGTILSQTDGLAEIEVEGGNKIYAISGLTAGNSVLACLRPEDVTLQAINGGGPTTSARNRCLAGVSRVIPQGFLFRVYLDCGFPLVAYVTKQSVEELTLTEGKQVVVSFKAAAIHLIER